MGKPKVVVIEDDPAVQFMYRFKLEHEGFDVRTADNGKTGLEVIKDFKPAVILLDLLMPVMSGTDMLRKLRETSWGSDVRVIILTNISKDEAPQELRFLHVDRYVVKAHTTPAEVVKIVQEVLGQKIK